MSTPTMMGTSPMAQATPSIGRHGTATPSLPSTSAIPRTHPINTNSYPPTSASMSDIVMDPLNQLHALSTTLFHSLAPVASKPPPIPPIMAFLEADAALADAVRLARIHQIKQRRIEKLKDEVLELEDRWRRVVEGLEESKEELEEILTEGEERARAIEEARTGALPSIRTAPMQDTHRLYLPIQLQYPTHNSSPTPNASRSSPPLHPTCLTLHYPVKPSA